MRHKTPKQLENVPIIGGFELKAVVFIIIGGLGFIFTMAKSFFLALLFPGAVSIYVYLSQKFKKEGELLNLVKYHTGSKVIVFDKTIEELVQRPDTLKKP